MGWRGVQQNSHKLQWEQSEKEGLAGEILNRKDAARASFFPLAKSWRNSAFWAAVPNLEIGSLQPHNIQIGTAPMEENHAMLH